MPLRPPLLGRVGDACRSTTSSSSAWRAASVLERVLPGRCLLRSGSTAPRPCRCPPVGTTPTGDRHRQRRAPGSDGDDEAGGDGNGRVPHRTRAGRVGARDRGDVQVPRSAARRRDPDLSHYSETGRVSPERGAGSREAVGLASCCSSSRRGRLRSSYSFRRRTMFVSPARVRSGVCRVLAGPARDVACHRGGLEQTGCNESSS